MKQPFSTEFLPLSECVHRLVQGMWGNVRRPQPIHKIKEHERDLSVGFVPRKEFSAALVRAAALAGKLRIYVRPRAGTVADREANSEPQRVPPENLETDHTDPWRFASASDTRACCCSERGL
jgi:hypothetical protein